MSEKKFEEAMERLERIVETLESGDLPLDESLKIFEEGMGLVNFCTKKLEEVEQKVTILIKESEEKWTQQPFPIEEKEGN
jgi:exodeoxyribonuclease VII small subunit